MTYTHRNGESATPTMPGLYWFRGRRYHQWRNAPAGDWFEDAGSLLIIHDDGDVAPYGSYWTCGGMTKSDGKWWGPVVAPWEAGR